MLHTNNFVLVFRGKETKEQSHERPHRNIQRLPIHHPNCPLLHQTIFRRILHSFNSKRQTRRLGVLSRRITKGQTIMSNPTCPQCGAKMGNSGSRASGATVYQCRRHKPSVSISIGGAGKAGRPLEGEARLTNAERCKRYNKKKKEK